MTDQIDSLCRHLGRVADLQHAAAVLEWDQETYMPDGAARARAHQVATLRELAHRLFTDDEVGALLGGAADAVKGAADASAFAPALVRVTRRDYERARRLPPELVADLAEAVSLAKQAWKSARETDDFAVFAPHLSRLLDLNRRKADALGFEAERYDALLDEYEPGMTTAEVARVFTDLREALVPLVHALAGRPDPDDAFLRRTFDRQKQWDFGMDVLRDIGYDLEHGRQDISAHPFTTSFSIHDVRLTTRIDTHYVPSALFSTLHEAGHGLYEQGIDPAFERTPLADGTSLAMHESQSRLWENLVGRGRPFWDRYYPRLQALFPEALGDVPLDTFYRGINRVTPSLIRVEADEVTYNLHIMLRFELERALIEGRLAVADLPAAWNDGMEAYLGLRPQNDAEGVLQDVHWSLGAFGYFPTYALGNLMSTQLFERLRADLPDLDDQIRAGRFAALLAWLRRNVHRYGRARTAGEILQAVTGDGLRADSWLAYVRDKYGALYGLQG